MIRTGATEDSTRWDGYWVRRVGRNEGVLERVVFGCLVRNPEVRVGLSSDLGTFRVVTAREDVVVASAKSDGSFCEGLDDGR